MPPPVPLAAFDGVAERVTVVEDLAQVALPEVRRDDVGLHPDRSLHEFGDRVARRLDGGGRVLLDQVEDPGVGDEAGLHHLGHARDEFVARQRLQRGEVHQHGRRLVEHAHEVLARVGVDAGLAAHRRVHHAQQGGGHVHQSHATHPGAGHEAGEVGDGAAAQAHHDASAVETDAAQDLPAEVRHGQRLAVLGVRDLDPVGVESGCGQLLPDGLSRGGERGRVDDRDSGRVAHRLGEVAQQAPPHDDVVRLRGPHRDTDGVGHRSLLTASLHARPERLPAP